MTACKNKRCDAYCCAASSLLPCRMVSRGRGGAPEGRRKGTVGGWWGQKKDGGWAALSPWAGSVGVREKPRASAAAAVSIETCPWCLLSDLAHEQGVTGYALEWSRVGGSIGPHGAAGSGGVSEWAITSAKVFACFTDSFSCLLWTSLFRPAPCATAHLPFLALCLPSSQVRCSKYLYTLCVTDGEKADKLRQSLPPGLQVKDI